MTKKVIMAVTTLLIALFMVGVASAGSTLTVDDTTKDVLIGGSVDFDLTLTTDDSGAGRLDWYVLDPAISATIEGDTDGRYDFTNTPGTPQTFTLTVSTESGATDGETYDTQVLYIGGTPIFLRAMATASSSVIPEVSTGILTAAGLIGMIGLVRFGRKD